MIDLIEDDDAVRLSTIAVFEAHGIKIRSHASAKAFLSAGVRSDCLVVDQHMPCITGLDLIAELRRSGDNTPAVLITGCESASIYKRARAYSVPVALKPVPYGNLIEIIEHLCRPSAEAS